VFCTHCTRYFHLPSQFHQSSSKKEREKDKPLSVCDNCRDRCLRCERGDDGDDPAEFAALGGIGGDGDADDDGGDGGGGGVSGGGAKAAAAAVAPGDRPRQSVLHSKRMIITPPTWDENDAYNDCTKCSKGLGRSKHNCRACGKMFCDDCTTKMDVPDAFRKKGRKGPQRVCDMCRFLLFKGAQLAESDVVTRSRADTEQMLIKSEKRSGNVMTKMGKLGGKTKRFGGGIVTGLGAVGRRMRAATIGTSGESENCRASEQRGSSMSSSSASSSSSSASSEATEAADAEAPTPRSSAPVDGPASPLDQARGSTSTAPERSFLGGLKKKTMSGLNATRKATMGAAKKVAKTAKKVARRGGGGSSAQNEDLGDGDFTAEELNALGIGGGGGDDDDDDDDLGGLVDDDDDDDDDNAFNPNSSAMLGYGVDRNPLVRAVDDSGLAGIMPAMPAPHLREVSFAPSNSAQNDDDDDDDDAAAGSGHGTPAPQLLQAATRGRAGSRAPAGPPPPMVTATGDVNVTRGRAGSRAPAGPPPPSLSSSSLSSSSPSSLSSSSLPADVTGDFDSTATRGRAVSRAPPGPPPSTSMAMTGVAEGEEKAEADPVDLDMLTSSRPAPPPATRPRGVSRAPSGPPPSSMGGGEGAIAMRARAGSRAPSGPPPSFAGDADLDMLTSSRPAPPPMAARSRAASRAPSGPPP
jgi:hypothetical protein